MAIEIRDEHKLERARYDTSPVENLSINNNGTSPFVYGERPITELFALNAEKEDLYSLIDKVELANGERPRIDNDREGPLSIIVEAPLGKTMGCADFVILTGSSFILFEVKPDRHENVKKRLDPQLERYYRYITSNHTRSTFNLVREIKSKESVRKSYLVCITGDESSPDLMSMYGHIENVDRSMVGWAPYDVIRSVLRRNGFEIKGISPHIWAEKFNE